jgi:transcriptional regulator
LSDRIYAKPDWRETRLPVLSDAMTSIRLAALVSAAPGGLKITHLPLSVRQQAGGSLRLAGHFARANDHWKLLRDGALPTAAIFQGPHAYISPSNYATKQETGKVVPTWAYIVVHAHGAARTIDDRQWLLELVNELTNQHETMREAPWKVSDAPDEYIEVMLRGIVGVEMDVERLEGVWKLNQHRPMADRQSTVTGLTGSGSEQDRAVGEAMQQVLDSNT